MKITFCGNSFTLHSQCSDMIPKTKQQETDKQGHNKGRKSTANSLKLNYTLKIALSDGSGKRHSIVHVKEPVPSLEPLLGVPPKSEAPFNVCEVQLSVNTQLYEQRGFQSFWKHSLWKNTYTPPLRRIPSYLQE